MTNVELLKPRDLSAETPGTAGTDEPGAADADGGSIADIDGGSAKDGGAGFPDGGDVAPGDPRACPADALICGGFDSSTAGWTLVRAGDTSIATTPDSAFGGGSLEASTTSSGSFAYAVRSGLAPLTAGSLYFRAFVKVPLGHAIDHYDILMLGNPQSNEGMVVGLDNSVFTLASLPQDVSRPGKNLVPRGTWFCLELDVPSSDFGGGATLRIDGRDEASLVDVDSLPAGGYTWAAVGILRTSSKQTSARVLIDEVVVATSPVGCSRPPGTSL